MDRLLYLTTLYHLFMYTVQTTNSVTDDHVLYKTGQQEVAVVCFTVWGIKNSVCYQYDIPNCRSQWPRCLMCGSAATCLLGLWVRIPPDAWMFSYVNVVCCAGKSLWDGLILRLGESYRCVCVCVCVVVCVWCVVCVCVVCVCSRAGVSLNLIECTSTSLHLQWERKSSVRAAGSSTCLSLQPGHYSSLPAPKLQPTANQERNNQCGNQHYIRELLMMGIVMPLTYWAYK